MVSAGKVRVDGTPATKPARSVGPGHVLTFVQAERPRVIKIIEIGKRRGPAPEAQALYEDLTPPEPPKPKNSVAHNPSFEGKGRPTKRDRRNMMSNRPDRGVFDLE